MRTDVHRRDKTNYYLDLAETVSQRCTCLRRHYGAVIVKNDEVISTGSLYIPGSLFPQFLFSGSFAGVPGFYSGIPSASRNMRNAVGSA